MKLDIGAGGSNREGFVNIDKYNYGNNLIVDIEKESLPFEDNSVDEIACYEVLEHIGHSEDNPGKLDGLIWAMNEMWRVLKPGGVLHGKVPSEGGRGAIADPTHKRVFITDSFDYFIGDKHPKRPRNADYGAKPWKKIHLDKGIKFKLTPNK